jgi:small subunit ribosomal protein S1
MANSLNDETMINSSMSDTDTNYDDMDSLLSSEEGMLSLEEGQIIKGKVLAIDNSGVIVDIGYKSEGVVPLSDFPQDSKGQINIKPGDEIEVFVQRTETSSGMVSLSKSKADMKRGSILIRQAYTNREPIEAVITAHNKAGYIVTFMGIQAFMPHSLSGFTSAMAPQLIGQTCTVQIIEMDERGSKIIASRRELADKERKQKKKEIFDTMKEGTRVKGIVKSIAPFGAFIDIGGVDGLLHISDISWAPIKSAEDVLKPGESIETIILKVDADHEKISLGLKQILPNPWDDIETRLPVGEIYEGKVTALTDYGAFVELQPGIEGMIHVSEMSWTQRIKHPKEMVTKGDTVKVKLLSIDKAHHRISLGLRQTQPDPWESVETKYAIGTVIKATITNMTDFGVFLKIEDGIEGFIHNNDFSWNKPIIPSEVYQVGQEIEARVLKYNKAKRRINLGVKQMTPDPWLEFIKNHKEGTNVKGTITQLTNSGVVVAFEGGVESFCPVKQLDSNRINDIKSFCKTGDEMEFKLVKIDKKAKKITISRRALIEEQEKAAIKSYMGQSSSIATNLGDLIRQASQNQNEEK